MNSLEVSRLGPGFMKGWRESYWKVRLATIKVVRLLSYKGSDDIRYSVLRSLFYIYTQNLKLSPNTISGCVDLLSSWCPLSRGAKSRAGRKHNATLHPESGKKLMLLWVVLWPHDTHDPCTRIVSQLNWICPDKFIVLSSGNILNLLLNLVVWNSAGSL